jgi:hypothetical protein
VGAIEESLSSTGTRVLQTKVEWSSKRAEIEESGAGGDEKRTEVSGE